MSSNPVRFSHQAPWATTLEITGLALCALSSYICLPAFCLNTKTPLPLAQKQRKTLPKDASLSLSSTSFFSIQSET
jgi:hypothetical protein